MRILIAVVVVCFLASLAHGASLPEGEECYFEVKGPRDGLNIYVNGVFTGKKTPALVDAHVGDLVSVRGDPAAAGGFIGVWLATGKEKAIEFTIRKFEYGWKVYAYDGHRRYLNGIIVRSDISPEKFEAIVRWSRARFITAERCAKLKSLDALDNHSELWALSVSNTPIRSFAALKTLTGLRALILDGTDFQEIEILKAMPHLRELSLASTKVFNVETLAELSKLERLSLFGTYVKDISPLFALKGLVSLDVCQTPAEEQFRNKIRGRFPRMFICACCGD